VQDCTLTRCDGSVNSVAPACEQQHRGGREGYLSRASSSFGISAADRFPTPISRIVPATMRHMQYRKPFACSDRLGDRLTARIACSAIALLSIGRPTDRPHLHDYCQPVSSIACAYCWPTWPIVRSSRRRLRQPWLVRRAWQHLEPLDGAHRLQPVPARVTRSTNAGRPTPSL
jgi:hypothetical protein